MLIPVTSCPFAVLIHRVLCRSGLFPPQSHDFGPFTLFLKILADLNLSRKIDSPNIRSRRALHAPSFAAPRTFAKTDLT